MLRHGLLALGKLPSPHAARTAVEGSAEARVVARSAVAARRSASSQFACRARSSALASVSLLLFCFAMQFALCLGSMLAKMAGRVRNSQKGVYLREALAAAIWPSQ